MSISKNPFNRFSSPASSLRAWCLGGLPFWLYSAFVIKAAILRPEEIPPVFFKFSDKLIHAVEFFLLFFFSVNAFVRAKNRGSDSPSFYAMLYCFGMAVLTEFLQLWVPGRSADVKDAASDMAGAAVAWMIFALLPNPLRDRSPGSSPRAFHGIF